MDNFLNSLLQIVIVLDILGLLAYFALGSLKGKKKTALPMAPVASRTEPGFWTRLRQRLPGRVSSEEGLDAALENLKRVLQSYQQGLV